MLVGRMKLGTSLQLGPPSRCSWAAPRTPPDYSFQKSEQARTRTDLSIDASGSRATGACMPMHVQPSWPQGRRAQGRRATPCPVLEGRPAGAHAASRHACDSWDVDEPGRRTAVHHGHLGKSKEIASDLQDHAAGTQKAKGTGHPSLVQPGSQGDVK